MEKSVGEQGRPISIRVHLSPEEARRLYETAEVLGLSPARVLRYGMLAVAQTVDIGEQLGVPCVLAAIPDPRHAIDDLPDEVVLMEPPQKVARRGGI